MIRAYIKNQADKQLEQMQLKLASSKSPIPCANIPHNRLWRFPFKPPALLGVIGFNPVMAMAADTVIVTAENIVPVGLIAPDHVVTPAPLVDYLVTQS